MNLNVKNAWTDINKTRVGECDGKDIDGEDCPERSESPGDGKRRRASSLW